MTTPSAIAGSGEHMVVAVAHPADETFGCGSLIASATRAGARVTIVCATRGEAGERRPDPVTDSWPLALLREAELCEAAVVLGADDVIFLAHVDSGFDGVPTDRALVDVSVPDLADELAERFEVLRPDVVVTLDGSDGHRDHRHLAEAVTVAVDRLDRPVRLLHSCLARSLMSEWQAAMRAIDPDRAHLVNPVHELGWPDDELTPIDTSAVLAVRERAIRCHLSQRSPFDGLPPALRHRFLTRDHVVEIRPTRHVPTPDPDTTALEAQS